MTTDERSALLTCSICGRPHTLRLQENFLAYAAARPKSPQATEALPCGACIDKHGRRPQNARPM